MNTTPTNSQTLKPTFHLLKYTFGIVPIVAGLDKFTNLLTNWESYLPKGLVEMTPFTPHTFMIIVGVIEIIAGIIVLIKPILGAYVVAAWLTLISFVLIASGNYFDIAVRDLVMAISVFSLGRIVKLVSE